MNQVAMEGLVETARLPLYTMRSAVTSSSLPKLLFLGGSSTDFQIKASVFCSPLVEHFNVVSFEPRGLGRSGAPDGDWSVEDYARDAIALMDAIGWGRVMIFGESFGAMTAMEIAIHFPERISHLCLSAAAPGGVGGNSYPIDEFLEMPERQKAIAALSIQNTSFPALMKSDSEAAEKVISARIIADTHFLNSGNNAIGYPRLLEARAKHDVFERLNCISAPTIVMSGTHDNQAPLACGQTMADEIPDAEFLLFEGGHGFSFATTLPSDALISRWAQQMKDT
ncbi:MAG: alpha/beta hydrolase [Hyphomicrobiales bacterium]